MSKPLYGLILGAILGAFDGLTAWFTPEVRNEMVGIVIGSTMKGLVAGLLVGFFARKFDSRAKVVVFGTLVGLFFAFLIAYAQGAHWVEIMLPGSLVGAITGFATQRHREAV